LLSATSDPESVSDLLHNEVEAGYWIGPFDKPPYDVYRINPVGIAQHKYSLKKRLIVDLSAPRDNPDHSSINDLIPKEDFSLSYVTIDDAIAIIKRLGPGTWLCKFDVKAAFKILPITKNVWPYYGICWENKFYFATRLVFGSRSSPKIFDCLAKAVEWIALENYGINNLLHLLDDFLALDRPNFEPMRTMAIMTHIFNSLRIPLAAHKTRGPTRELEFLGIILDSARMEARLPDNKKSRIMILIDTFLGKRTCIKRELLSLIGHLVFASRVILPGRTFISRLIESSKRVKSLHYRVTLTSDCKEDLHMWSYLLSQWNGVSLFLDNEPTSADDLHLFTDASGTIGYSGYYQGQWFANRWDPCMLDLLKGELSIAFQELYPIVLAAMLWGKSWSRKRIQFHCDNKAVVYILNKGRSPCSAIMKLMRRLVIVATLGNFHFSAIHVPSKKNEIADSLSRMDFQRFRQLAPDATEQPCILPTEIMFR
jgi:hypothetical protein